MTTDLLELVGSVLDERFRVDAIVEEGDLTLTYKGHDIEDDKLVSIRCLNVPTTLDPSLTAPFVTSFRERTRLHRRLAPGHSSFVQTIASGSTVARRTRMTVPYEIREWLDGTTFAAYSAKRRAEKAERWPIEFVLTLLEPVATGLAYLHSQGLVHCEVNPNNLFVLDAKGEPDVKLVDVGEGRKANGKSEQRPVLRVLVPEYTAPEQVDKLAGAIGGWTDVFSLAVIVVECLAGGLGTGGVAAVVVIDPENRPSPQKLGLALPPGLENVLERALSLDPARRPDDAAIFWRELEAAAVWETDDDVASTRIKVSPAKLVESATSSIASSSPPAPPKATTSVAPPVPSSPPKGPRNPFAKSTLVGLQPAGKADKSKPPIAPSPLRDAKATRTEDTPTESLEPKEPEKGADAKPTEAKPTGADAKPSSLPEREPVRADISLPDVKASPVEAEPSVFMPALGQLPFAVRLRLAASRGRAEVVLQWARLRLWVEERAWPWIVARVRETPPRMRAIIAASAFVGLLLLVLAIKVVVLVAHGTAGVQPSSSGSPSASVSATVRTSPPDPSSAPSEAVSIELPPLPSAAPDVAASFSRAAATAALQAAGGDLTECEALGGVRSPGTLRVTFDKSGTVTRIRVNPLYADTPEGICILDRFARAQMTPFRGAGGTLNYTFQLPQ